MSGGGVINEKASALDVVPVSAARFSTNSRKRKHERVVEICSSLNAAPSSATTTAGHVVVRTSEADGSPVCMVKMERMEPAQRTSIDADLTSPRPSSSTPTAACAWNPESFPIPPAGLNFLHYRLQQMIAAPSLQQAQANAMSNHTSQTPDSTEPSSNNNSGPTTSSSLDTAEDQEPDLRLSTDGSPTPSDVFAVTCGTLAGKLHMDKFYCPGIHQLCVEYDGRLISPKQFTIVAGKDKQKDWKAAIKMNQQNLRLLFEKSKIDFYKHSDFCSGRCVSKVVKPLVNNINGNGQENNDNSNTSISADITLPSDYDHQNAIPPSVGYVVEAVAADCKEQQLNQQQILYNHVLASVAGAAAAESPPTVSTTSNGHWHPHFDHVSESTIFSDPLSFWTALFQLGIFFELTQEIDEQLNVLRTCFKLPDMRYKAAHKLSELVKVLDLKDKIHEKLLSKRSLTKAQSVVAENELCGTLSATLSQLKKIAEAHEKKQKEIKRKAEIFDQLISATLQQNHQNYIHR